MEKVLLIDGMNMFIRNWAVMSQTDSNGNHVGGVLGFIRSLKMCIRETKASVVYVIWDGIGGSRFRRGVYSEYKAGRKPKVVRDFDFDSVDESKKNFDDQLSKVKSYVEAFGIISIEVAEVEADDVIGYICQWVLSDIDKVVVSSDNDFLQLVNDTTVVYSPVKKIYYTKDKVLNEYNILSENFIYMKALTGDKSDNIKGIKGIGKVKVLKLFPFLANTVCTAEELINFAIQNALNDNKYKVIVDNEDKIRENIKLMQLSSPKISTVASRIVRESVNERQQKLPNMTSIKISLLRDNIQITDGDFFQVFEEYKIRLKRRLLNAGRQADG